VTGARRELGPADTAEERARESRRTVCETSASSWEGAWVLPPPLSQLYRITDRISQIAEQH
jgi:hypothetical protein